MVLKSKLILLERFPSKQQTIRMEMVLKMIMIIALMLPMLIKKIRTVMAQVMYVMTTTMVTGY